uniref:Uncharacterized protein n=1 Tax=Anopheles coluzzii TaxID=1518534 RepID=A0A8W7P3C4_ANOCL
MGCRRADISLAGSTRACSFPSRYTEPIHPIGSISLQKFNSRKVLIFATGPEQQKQFEPNRSIQSSRVLRYSVLLFRSGASACAELISGSFTLASFPLNRSNRPAQKFIRRFSGISAIAIPSFVMFRHSSGTSWLSGTFGCGSQRNGTTGSGTGWAGVGSPYRAKLLHSRTIVLRSPYARSVSGTSVRSSGELNR